MSGKNKLVLLLDSARKNHFLTCQYLPIEKTNNKAVVVKDAKQTQAQL